MHTFRADRLAGVVAAEPNRDEEAVGGPRAGARRGLDVRHRHEPVWPKVSDADNEFSGKILIFFMKTFS